MGWAGWWGGLGGRGGGWRIGEGVGGEVGGLAARV